MNKENSKSIDKSNRKGVNQDGENKRPSKSVQHSVKLHETNKLLLNTLHNERNLLRTLIDNLPDAIFVKDKDCRKVIANPADVHNMGFRFEREVLGKDDFELFPEEIAERFYEDDKSVISTGKPVLDREEFFLDEKGKKRWLRTSKLPLKDEQNEIIGIIGIGRDITLRKQLEDSLKNERNLLRTLIDNIPDLIYFKDAAGRYVLNNHAHLKSLGVKYQNETVGKSVFDFHPAKLASLYHEDEMYIINSGKPLIEKEEMAVHHDNGKQYWHLTSKIPLTDSSGKVTGIIGISRNITQHKEADEKIHKLNRVYEVLSNVNQTVVRAKNIQSLFNEVCKIAVEVGKLKMAWIGVINNESKTVVPAASYGDAEGDLEEINIQVDNDEYRNRPTAIVIEMMEYCVSNDIESDPRMSHTRKSALEHGYRSFCALPLIVFEKMHAILYLYSAQVNFFDEEEMRLLDEMAMDISFCLETLFNEEERLKYEMEILNAKEKAEEANRLKNSFLARMSHELRTPLNVILGNCGILKEVNNDKVSETLKNIFNSIEEESMRLLTSMTELFDISSIESATFTIDLKPLSLNEYVTASYQSLNPNAVKKGLRVLLNQSEEVIVKGDDYCLKGVIDIILRNAIKFSDSGTINIKVASSGTFGLCSITDEGIGISQDYQKQLFESFSQEDVGYSRQFDGLGLGLALTRKYIDFMNGNIKIESKKGIGTTVILLIPLFSG